ncbi:pentatricopeptide repeat-containing protein At3g22470, mitochondrial-like [Alnus glutinosa]|uniref:pentatricopeptide repeat-containing protein At3g22470, mitochondrial-like n=1 Tax=Alnus glutinosa TaxID=3517 RepID=UPI002D787086|nr:pentatricopeptide repeat-containing protein At3g22470, mitochondrial-like [Alnus glutinosa]
MTSKGIQPDVFTYNSLIQGLCNFGRWKEAIKLWKEMVKRKIMPDVRTFNIVTDTLGKEWRFEEAKEVYDVMIQRGIYREIFPDVVTYNSLIGGFCRVGKLKNALELLHEMQDFFGRSEMEMEIVWIGYQTSSLFHEMEDKKLHLDIVIYSILIDGMYNAEKLMIGRELFNTLPTKGLQANVRTYNIMIKGLCKEGLLIEAMELFEKMEENGCSPNDFTYNTIIQGFLQHNETSWVVKYIKTMVDKGFSANATTATILIDLLSTNRVDKTLQGFFQIFV